MFLTWKGDHGPKHVHVLKDGKTLVTWDLENGVPMKGLASAKIRKLIRDLVAEGKL